MPPDPLCPGCTRLAERPITVAACAAGLRRASGADPLPEPATDRED